MDEPLTPAREIRPNLDVVPGGKYVRRVTATMTAEMTDRKRAGHAVLALARALLPVADDYDVVIIDSPPRTHPLCSSPSEQAGGSSSP
jgi:chromosome partitioning protein